MFRFLTKSVTAPFHIFKCHPSSGQFFLTVIPAVDIDAAIIRNLTKDDVVKFYNKFISPSSPDRSKISVHMHAAAIPQQPSDVAKGQEQKALLAQALSQFLLTQSGISADAARLSKALGDIDLTKPESIITSVTTFLAEEMKLADEKVKTVIAQGTKVLVQLLPALIGPPPPEEVEGDQGIIIEDISAFKAGLEMTKGARPVRPLVEFEESSVKL